MRAKGATPGGAGGADGWSRECFDDWGLVRLRVLRGASSSCTTEGGRTARGGSVRTNLVDLIELRLLLAVAETGSVAAASKLTGYSRATLARRLEELEARAGVSLLERRRDGSVLTEAGQRLAAKAAPMIEEASTLLRVAGEYAPNPDRPIRLAVPAGMHPFIHVAVYPFLRQRFTALRFETRLVNTTEELRPSEVDVAVHFGAPPTPDRWVTGPLTPVRTWLLASPSYLEQHGRPATIADLGDHELIGWLSPGHPTDRWPTIEGDTFAVTPRLVHSDMHIVRHLARAGHGIALVPEGDIDDPHLDLEALEPVLPDAVGHVVQLSYSVPAALADTPRIAPLLEAIVAFAERF